MTPSYFQHGGPVSEEPAQKDAELQTTPDLIKEHAKLVGEIHARALTHGKEPLTSFLRVDLEQQSFESVRYQIADLLRINRALSSTDLSNVPYLELSEVFGVVNDAVTALERAKQFAPHKVDNWQQERTRVINGIQSVANAYFPRV